MDIVNEFLLPMVAHYLLYLALKKVLTIAFHIFIAWAIKKAICIWMDYKNELKHGRLHNPKEFIKDELFPKRKAKAEG